MNQQQRRQLNSQIKKIQTFAHKMNRNLMSEGYSKSRRDRMVLESTFDLLASLENEKRKNHVNEDFSILDTLGTIARAAITGGKDEDVFGGLFRIGKEKVASYVIEKFGVDPNSFIGRLFANTFSEISFSDLTSVFKPGGCKMIITRLTKGLEQTGLEGLEDALAEALGLDTDSALATTFKRGIADYISNTQFLTALATGIGNAICDLDPAEFTNALSGTVKQATKNPDVKGKLQSVAAAKPNMTNQINKLLGGGSSDDMTMDY
jgi:hypothetical protein